MTAAAALMLPVDAGVWDSLPLRCCVLIIVWVLGIATAEARCAQEGRSCRARRGVCVPAALCAVPGNAAQPADASEPVVTNGAEASGCARDAARSAAELNLSELHTHTHTRTLYIHSICRVMNHALSSVGVKFAYEEPKERRPKAYRVFLESGLPRFLASELSATLGYSQWVAFFSIAKHTCSRRCREGLVFCPNSFSVAEETSRLRLKLTAVNAKLVDPQRALSAAVRDVDHARRMLDALDHTPEALLSDEGRWARRLRELEQLV